MSRGHVRVALGLMSWVLGMLSTPAIATEVATAVVVQDCSVYGGPNPCFESLADWQANWGDIDWGAHAPGNLVAADLVAEVQIDGAWTQPDTQPVNLSGWVTDPGRYVAIAAVGQARHDGTPGSGYRLATNDPSERPLLITVAHVRIDGLEIHAGSSFAGHVVYLSPGTAPGVGDIRISHCLIHGNGSTSACGVLNNSCRGFFRAWDNIIYDVGEPGYTAGIQIGAGTAYLYGNTIVNLISGFGIRSGGDKVVAANNLIAAPGSDFYGSFWPGSDFNASSDHTAPGFNSQRDAVFEFVNQAAHDFHLAVSDQGAANRGRDLSADPNLPFGDDVDGQVRSGGWDIGADESAAADTVVPVRMDGAPTGTLPSDTTEAVLSLSTNEVAECRFDTAPGVAFPDMATTFAETGGTEHAHLLSGLHDEQWYSYFVRCRDGAGNANSTDYEVAFFVASADTVPPVITDVQVGSLSPYSATVSWTTDEPCTSQVSYGAAGTAMLLSPLAAELVLEHSVDLADLDPGVTYDPRVRSRDIARNETVSSRQRFTTPAPSGPFHWVDQNHPQADDGNPGTQSLPWATIQHAADVAQPGDTITVMPGDYGRVAIRSGGAPGQWVTFRGATTPDQSLVDPGAVYDPSDPVQVPGNPALNAVTRGFDLDPPYGVTQPVAWVRVESFEVTAVYDGSTDGQGGIRLQGTDHVQLVGNFLHDLNPNPSGYGYMGVRGETHDNVDVVVRGNTLYRVQGTGINVVGQRWLVEDNDLSHGLDNNTDSGALVGGDSDAVRFFGSGHLIRHNRFHDYLDEEQVGDPHIDCFQTFSVYPDSQFADHVVVEGNLCDDFGQMLMVEDSAEASGLGNKVHDLSFRNNVFHAARAIAINGSRADHSELVNNVFVDGNYSGIGLILSPYLTVVDNIFSNNGSGSQIVDQESKVGTVWDYNLHDPDFSWPPKQPEFDQNSMFGVEPGFVDPASGDYHLSRQSPAVDAGCELESFNYDRDWALRPQGLGWDIGAYEDVPLLFGDDFESGDATAWSLAVP